MLSIMFGLFTISLMPLRMSGMEVSTTGTCGAPDEGSNGAGASKATGAISSEAPPIGREGRGQGRRERKIDDAEEHWLRRVGDEDSDVDRGNSLIGPENVGAQRAQENGDRGRVAAT